MTIDLTADGIPVAFLAPRLFWGFYERGEIQFVHDYLDPSLDVVELGGGIGVVTAHVARLLTKNATFVCIEANYKLIPAIERNLEINVPGHSVTVVHGAIDYSGLKKTAFAIRSNILASQLARNQTVSLEVPALQLHTLLSTYKLGDYTLICDIEGAELDLVMRPKGTLARCRMIIAELHPESFAQRNYDVCRFERRLREVHEFERVKRRGNVFCFAARH
jgi:FkbM family methyltransferase